MSDIIPPLAPNGLAEIIEHFGDPKVQIVNGEWVVDRAWESANMVTIQHPLMPKGKLFVHHLVARPMLNLLERWSARIQAGDPYRVRTLGSFAPRAQRGSNGFIPSTHTWGIAFDLNADTNPLISNIDPDDSRRRTNKDIPDAWIADARAEGWFWGGAFLRRFDAMHFQMATGF